MVIRVYNIKSHEFPRIIHQLLLFYNELLTVLDVETLLGVHHAAALQVVQFASLSSVLDGVDASGLADDLTVADELSAL